MQITLADGRRMSTELWSVIATLNYAKQQDHDASVPFDQMPRDVIVQSLPHTLDIVNMAAKKPSMNGQTIKAIRARLSDPQWDDRTVRLAHEILYSATTMACQKMRKQVDAQGVRATTW